jgi:hypothetical protein
MRRYLVTVILLIISAIDFALAAPVLVQEERQAPVDVANTPKDVTTVLEKRWGEEIEELGEEYFKTGKSIGSSDTHSSSSSAPYPASSTSNPDQLMEPSCSSSTSMRGLSARGNTFWKTCVGLLEDMVSVDDPLQGPGFRPGPMLYTSPSAHGQYRKLPTTEAPAPQSMSSADPNFDWEYWTNAEVPQRPSTLLRPVPPTDSERGQASGHGPGPPSTEFHYPGSPKTPPTTESYSYPGPPTAPENEVVPEPAQSPDSELQLDRPSLSADEQPVDLGAIIYTAKGKTKQMRHISGTTKGIGNADQRELQPAERSLDPGE